MDLSIVSQFMSLSPDMMYKATKMVESAKAYFPGDVDAQEQYLNENLIDTTLEYALTLLEDKKIRDYMGVAVYTNGTTFSAPTLALYNVASMPEMKQRIQGKLNAKSGVRKEETELVQEKKRPKLKGRKFNGKNPWWNSDGDDKPYEPGDDVRKTKNEETSVEKIDRISREKVAQRAMAAKKDREARAASTAKFKEFKSAHIASGGTPVSALDAWQKKKMASAKKESVDYVAELWKGRHGQSEKEYQAGRSDAGKRISGDADTGPNYYTKGRARGAKPDAPTAPGARPVNTPKLSSSEREYHQYNKSSAKTRAQYNKVGGSKGLPEEVEMVSEEDPCWKGYTQVGMKKKGGREVPNCVPSKGVPKAKGYKKEDIEFVADFLISEGLNEYGIDILIEEMGLDGFCDFVDEITSEEILLEWRRGAGGTKVRGSGMSKSGKSIGSLKGGAKASAIRGSAEHKARKAEKEKESSKSSGMKAALQSQSKIAMAKKSQPATKSTPTQTKEKAKGGILGALKARAQRDTELLKKSVDTARKVGARRAAEVKATYDAVRAKGKEAEKSASATRARRKATVATGRAAQAAGRTAVKAAGAAGAAAGEAVKAKRAGKTAAQVAGRAAGTFIKKMKKEERELLTRYFLESEIAFNYDEVQEIFESLDQEHFDYFIEQAQLMVEESGPSARELIEEKLQNTFDIERFTFADWRQLTEKKSSDDDATGKFVSLTQTNRTDNTPDVKGKRKDGVIINPQVDMRREEVEQIDEVSPPGAKFKRMAKHIKAGYAKDGLTDKEKRIAFATAWQQYNKQKQDEQTDPEAAKTAAQSQQRMKAQQQMQRKQLMLQQQRLQMQKQGKLPMGHTEEVEHLDELNRYEKETGKSSGSLNMPAGRPTQTGGDTDPALRSVRQTMRKMSGTPAGQQKKVPGKKPPVAGQYGAPASPAQKVAQRRAAAQRAKDNMSSRFD
jgi:hypothetical protein